MITKKWGLLATIRVRNGTSSEVCPFRYVIAEAWYNFKSNETNRYNG